MPIERFMRDELLLYHPVNTLLGMTCTLKLNKNEDTPGSYQRKLFVAPPVLVDPSHPPLEGLRGNGIENETSQKRSDRPRSISPVKSITISKKPKNVYTAKGVRESYDLLNFTPSNGHHR